MMKWEAEEKGYTCNDCYLSMQNCHDKGICCEDETGLCNWFEEVKKMTLFEARFENKKSGGISLEIPCIVDPSICTDDEELWIQAFNHAWRRLEEEGFDPDKYRLRELRLIAL